MPCKYKNLQSILKSSFKSSFKSTHPSRGNSAAWDRDREDLRAQGGVLSPDCAAGLCFPPGKRNWNVDNGQETPRQGLFDPNPDFSPPGCLGKGQERWQRVGGSRSSSWSRAVGPGWDFWDALGREQRLSESWGSTERLKPSVLK